MKAALIEELGGPEKVLLSEIPEPSPGPGEVRLEVRAAGLGPWDLKTMRGVFGKATLPYVIGFEFAGVIDQLGEGVSGLAVGDEVYGTDWKAGSLAEYRVAMASACASKPKKMTFEEAVALPVAGTTALEGLIERLELTEGDSVVITAAAGGVGTVAVQLAHDTGATVVAVCSARNHDYARSLGADMVFDYHDAGWEAAVREAFAGGVDKLFDCAGGTTLAQALETVRDGGRAAGIVYSGPDTAPRGISFDRFSAGSGSIRLETIARMVDEDRLRVELETELPLSQAREALERVDGGHTRGKVVLKLY